MESVAEIDALKHGIPLQDYKERNKYPPLEITGAYIAYFVAAKKSPDLRLAGIATEHLTSVSSLAPAFASLAARAEAAATGPKLPFGRNDGPVLPANGL